MAAINTIVIPSLTLEEILSDGSTLTNPAADGRRLFLGEDGELHLRDSAGTVTDVSGAGAGAGVNDVVRLGASDVTTTSTSFVDLTGFSITMTTGAHRVLLLMTGFCYNSGANFEYFTFTVDGTEVSSRTNGLCQISTGASGSGITTFTMHFLTDVLTAASHTFKVQWKVSAGTGTFYGNASNQMRTFSAIEQGS